MAWIRSSTPCWIWLRNEFYFFWVIIVWSYQALLEVLSATWFGIFFGIWVILLLCVEKKFSPFWFWIYWLTQVSYVSRVLLRQIESVCVRKRLSLHLVIDICGLQFGIVREVCYRLVLVLVLRFGDLLSLGALQLLDLLCGALFGLCAIGIWYLWIFGSLVCIWFFSFVFLRESYLSVFGIWVYESASMPICIIPNLLQWILFFVARGCRLLLNHINS